jgi:hypothetical protein
MSASSRLSIRLTSIDFLTNGVPLATMMRKNRSFVRLAKEAKHRQTHILSNLRRKNCFDFPLPRIKLKFKTVSVVNEKGQVEDVVAANIHEPFRSDTLNDCLDTVVLHRQPRSKKNRLKEPAPYRFVYSDGLSDNVTSHDPYNDDSSAYYYKKPSLVLLTPQYLMPQPRITLEDLHSWPVADDKETCIASNDPENLPIALGKKDDCYYFEILNLEKLLIPDADPLFLKQACEYELARSALIKDHSALLCSLSGLCKNFPELKTSCKTISGNFPKPHDDPNPTVRTLIHSKYPDFPCPEPPSIQALNASAAQIKSYVNYILLNLDPDFITNSLPSLIKKRLRQEIDRWLGFVKPKLLASTQNDTDFWVPLKNSQSPTKCFPCKKRPVEAIDNGTVWDQAPPNDDFIDWYSIWDNKKLEIIDKFVRDQGKIVRWCLENAHRLAAEGHEPRAIVVIPRKQLFSAFRRDIINYLKKYGQASNKFSFFPKLQLVRLSKRPHTFSKNFWFKPRLDGIFS